MIVTSMRCYLNILTQLMSREDLLNAQYYICDSVGVTIYNEDQNYNMIDGVYEQVPNNEIADRASRYLVEYADQSCSLNIDMFLTQQTIDYDKISKSKHPLDRLAAYIGTDAFKMAFYNKSISKMRADKLFIFIFMDEITVRYGGDLICQMLSYEFGQDVTFIDPKYRPYVRGRVSYAGNKAHGAEVIEKIRKQSRIAGYMAAISNSMYGGYYGDDGDKSTISNIAAYLSAFETPEELIEFHNLLWPDDDLPPGKYTRGDVEEIIIQKTFDDMSTPRTRSTNIGIIDAYSFGR